MPTVLDRPHPLPIERARPRQPLLAASGRRLDRLAAKLLAGPASTATKVSVRLCGSVPITIIYTVPFHVHGAGRFLILSRDGVVEESLVWKDTALVRTGETVDILLDVTNVGLWMAHCHIAEHMR